MSSVLLVSHCGHSITDCNYHSAEHIHTHTHTPHVLSSHTYIRTLFTHTHPHILTPSHPHTYTHTHTHILECTDKGLWYHKHSWSQFNSDALDWAKNHWGAYPYTLTLTLTPTHTLIHSRSHTHSHSHCTCIHGCLMQSHNPHSLIIMVPSPGYMQDYLPGYMQDYLRCRV